MSSQRITRSVARLEKVGLTNGATTNSSTPQAAQPSLPASNRNSTRKRPSNSSKKKRKSLSYYRRNKQAAQADVDAAWSDFLLADKAAEDAAEAASADITTAAKAAKAKVAKAKAAKAFEAAEMRLEVAESSYTNVLKEVKAHIEGISEAAAQKRRVNRSNTKKNHTPPRNLLTGKNVPPKNATPVHSSAAPVIQAETSVPLPPNSNNNL